MIKNFISLSVKLTFKKLFKYFSKLVFILYFCDKNNEKSVINWFLYKLLLKNSKQNTKNSQRHILISRLLIISFLIPLGINGQQIKPNYNNHHNDQNLTKENIDLYREFVKTKLKRRESNIELPVILHIVRKSNGETDYNLNKFISQIPNGFVTINKISTRLNIRFYLARINYIDSDYLYGKDIKRQDYVNFLNPNCTNFFITNKGGSFSSFPNSSTTPNAVFFSKNMFGSPAKHVNSNLPHEIGHYLGLFHTHTSTEYGNSYVLAENVARDGKQSNCSSTGDYLCSTLADPYNSNDKTDKYGTLYIADKSNFMSYYTDHRDHFTDEQLNIMRNALEYRLNDDRYDLDGYQNHELIQAPKITHIESTSLYNNLKWTHIESNLGYIVERANLSIGSEFEPISGLGKNSNELIDYDIQSNTKYSYRVIPVNSPNNYSDTHYIETSNVYCNTSNTCDGFGFVPESIILTNGKSTLINFENINCNNSASVIDYSDAVLKSNSDISIEIAQSRVQEFFYNLFIDLNGDGIYNDKEEWVVKNEISTDKYSYLSKFNLALAPIKQGQTSMRIICSIYQNTSGKYPIEDSCNINLGFTQDFKITLLDQSKEVFWMGNTNQDWFTPSNWSNNSVPDSSVNVIIPDELNQYPIINDLVNFNSLKVESGASLISTIPIEGEITYEKKLKSYEWSLISSPFLNQTVDKLVKNNKLIINSKEEVSLSYFNTINNTWNCFMNNSDNHLNIGKGYSIRLNESKVVTTSGKLTIEDTTVPIITGNDTNMNLIGNPFLAYTNSEKFLNSNSINLSENTIWTWNGDYYQAHNNMNPIEIEPGQGFFVDAKEDGNITFRASDVHHMDQNTHEVLNPFTIELHLENSMKKRSTKIYYSKGKSIDFDNGYDSKIFTENTDLLVFSELILENKSKKLTIQTLPDSNYNEMIIPIGFKTTTRQELTLSAELLNLPDDVEVILEDRTYNKFINLKKDTYVFSPTKNSIETGRFFIHTKQTIIDETDNSIENFQVFKSGTNEITIKNLRLNGLLQVYSIEGKVILDSSFEASQNNKIKFNQPASGIYLVAISTEEGKIIKKMKF